VKLLAADETRTITVLQGRGTALYTPLEQYGGETGHTDARSDIYSLGATLYHLLTNEPPVEAKQRFLNPSSLKPIRVIRPEVSQRTAKGVEWAMALHPDDRPADVTVFQNALLGKTPVPAHRVSDRKASWDEVFGGNRILALVAALMLLVALVATVLSPLVPAP
jgi:serine/threonine protein kinase